jgi:transcriptional regulator with XRE-family HTH domain
VSFAETLGRLREVAGLSQMDLCRRSGISIDSLRNWEQDRALPRVDAVVKLALALGVGVNDLVAGIEVEIPEPQAKRKPRKQKVR